VTTLGVREQLLSYDYTRTGAMATAITTRYHSSSQMMNNNMTVANQNYMNTRISDGSLTWLMKSASHPQQHCRCRRCTWPQTYDQPLKFDGSDFQLDYEEESIHLFLSAVLNNDGGSSGDCEKGPKHMELRNLTLSKTSQRELIKVLSKINDDLESLTLSNVSCSSIEDNDDRSSDEMDVSYQSSSPLSSSTSQQKVLNCGFLLKAGVQLDKLTIERCRLDSETARTLGEAVAFCNVQHFKMNHVTFLSSTSTSTTTTTTESCDELTGRMFGDGLAKAGCTLTTLEIRQVSCTESHQLFANLLQGLRPCIKLEKLHLEGCGLGSSPEKQEDVRQLAYLVTSLQKLSSLNLCQNNISSDGLEMLLERGFSCHPSLRECILSQNPIGDDGARHFASFLHANTATKISSLSISDCDIWSPGCEALIKSLAQNSTLRKLDVDEEWQNHLKTLAVSLETNMTLMYLSTPQLPSLLHNMDEQWKKVEYYLRLNRAKRRILVAEPQVPLSFWSIVLGQSSSDPDVAFHLLQQRPDIVEECEE
jgi:hypothetical protein